MIVTEDGFRIGAQLAAHLEPVDVRQPDVEQHHVGLSGARKSQRVESGRGINDTKTGSRKQSHLGVARGFIVVYDQDSRLMCGTHTTSRAQVTASPRGTSR